MSKARFDSTQAALSLADFNAPNDGSADARPALQAALLAGRDRGLGVFVPKGTYRLDSRLDTIDYVTDLRGLGSSNTGAYLIKNYAEAVADRAMIEFAPGADGSRVSGFFVKNVAGGGTIIGGKASSSLTLTNISLDDLNLSLDDATPPDHYIHFDGTMKSTGALGCRINSMRNVKCFGSLGAGWVFRGCNGVFIYGGGLYPAGVSNSFSGTVAFSGTSGVTSGGIDVSIQGCAGLIFSQVNGALVQVQNLGAPPHGRSVDADATVANAKVRYGTISGSVNGGGWVNSSAAGI